MTIGGSGFPPDERGITLTYDGAPISPGLAASAQGAWTVNLVIPPSPGGVHTFAAAGGAMQGSLALNASFTVVPGLTTSRPSGPPGVHSADEWRELLEPVVKGYLKKGVRLLFRADAAFAKPEVYKYLEAEGMSYAIRLPANRCCRSVSVTCWNALANGRRGGPLSGITISLTGPRVGTCLGE